MSLYEGTTGIQSLDLLGRKVTIANGRALQLLSETIIDTITKASVHSELKAYAGTLGQELKQMETVLMHLSQFALKGEVDRYLADATVFMEMAGYIVIGWQWLKQALVAVEKLAVKDFHSNSESFCQSKVHTMEFYFQYELPHTAACAKTILASRQLTNIKDHTMFS